MVRERLPLSKQVAFSIGQLGWSMLGGLISSWLVYFYQPTEDAGIRIMVPQGRVILGLLTVVGLITAIGRVFDAVTDPWIASLSDRLRHPRGRRIPFLRTAAVPFALLTALVFWAPFPGAGLANATWLLLALLGFYLLMTAYCTPFNALIPELGHTAGDRLNISTYISLTFIVGTAAAYVAPVFWGALESAGVERVLAMRIVIGALCVLAALFMLVPALVIDEKRYVHTVPSQTPAFSSLKKTFANRDFRVFVVSDISYFIALTLFQTGLPFYVKVLLGLPESQLSLLFVLMTACSLVFYPVVNIMARRWGKKPPILLAFALFAVMYAMTFFLGRLPFLSTTLQGYLLVAVAAFPMAIFGILPQAVVADISLEDAGRTGEYREGMFFAARTFAFKMGQTLAMLLFTSFLTLGSSSADDIGIRLSAVGALAFCALGLSAFLFYDERKVMAALKAAEKADSV